jgi:hypothetical protein
LWLQVHGERSTQTQRNKNNERREKGERSFNHIHLLTPPIVAWEKIESTDSSLLSLASVV